MKCVHCGGEVDSQTVECPYCGSRNEEGIRFQQIVSEKIKKNKLLEKMLYKKQTLELVNESLSKIVFVMLVLCIFFIGGATALLINREEICEVIGKKPAECTEGSLAKTYEEQYLNEYGYSNLYVQWRNESQYVLSYINSGTVCRQDKAESMVYEAKCIMHDDDLPEEVREAALLEVEAVFVDILGFTEEEMALFEENDQAYTYARVLTPEVKAELGRLVIEKLQAINELEEGK